MISLKVLTAATAMALLLPMAAPTESFAQNSHGSGVRHGGAVHAGRSARGLHHSAPAVRLSDGGWQNDGYGRDKGVFIPGSVIGGLGFYDYGYYER